MPKRGENIYKRKDGRWEGRYIKCRTLHGRIQYGYVYGKSYSEVKSKLKETTSMPIQTSDSRAPQPTSYSEILKMWLLSAKNHVKDSTFSRYNHLVICSTAGLSVKRSRKNMRVLSEIEQRQLEYVLMQDMDLTKFTVLLCLYTGIRIGEVCALRWEHIRLDSGILEVRETMQRIQTPQNMASKTRIIITEPKSASSNRDIPLPQFLMQYAVQFQADRNAFVLTGEKNQFIEPRTLQNRFRNYVKTSGIEHANYHALRHTFATRCVELGFEIKSLSEILGHSNVNITLNKYVHSSFELKKKNMERLNLTIIE